MERFSQNVDLDLTGEQIDKWELVRPLGQGGMAVVYEAKHIWLNQRAAVKLLHPNSYGDPDALERFQQEALVVSHLAHPHIVEVRDFGEDVEHSYFMVMELLDGQDLGQFLTKAPFSLALVSAILGQVCEAIEAIHTAKVIHRDLKPSNIFLMPDDPHPYVKVLDFGIAKAHFQEDGRLTATNSILGTPQYLAPEQIRAKQTITPQTDLYALGVIIFQLLCGRLPFDGEGTFEHMMSIVQEEAPPIGCIRPDLKDTPIEALIAQMLAKDPAKRPNSAKALWKKWDEALKAFSPDELGAECTHLYIDSDDIPTGSALVKQAQTCSLHITGNTPAQEVVSEESLPQPSTMPALSLPTLSPPASLPTSTSGTRDLTAPLERLPTSSLAAPHTGHSHKLW